MRQIIITLVSHIFGLLTYGQIASTDPIKIPNYIPKSLEAAGFAKYGDIPVSEHTGTVNISIPIYVVKSGKLSLPIDLSYHSSGIQIGQEATWVGLGWNLIAGGSISYDPVGGNEQINGISLPSQDREAVLTYIGAGEPGVTTEGRLTLTIPKNKNI